MKIVLDTNVIISAYLWGGLPEKIFALAESKKLTIYTSIEQITELVGVLNREKFALTLTKAGLTPDELVLNFLRLTRLVFELPSVDVIKEDPTDNNFLACAQKCGADYIITGDRHLKVLKKFGKTMIVSPRQFLTLMLRI